MAVLTVVAGPNGSGKTSVIKRVEFAGRANLLEADAIASQIYAAAAMRAAIPAGREVLRRAQEFLDSAEDFAIETTLSGNWTRRLISESLVRHLFVRLLYICLDSPERCIQCVNERVAQGGHDIPATDVRRRYFRSLGNLRQVLGIVDEVIVYDNSGLEPRQLPPQPSLRQCPVRLKHRKCRARYRERAWTAGDGK